MHDPALAGAAQGVYSEAYLKYVEELNPAENKALRRKGHFHRKII